MASPLYVTNEDVKLLHDRQLVALLSQLIYLELSANQISSFSSQVPLSIYIKDGGIDGLARWDGGPPRTARLPSRYVGFQAKATDLSDAGCRAEVKTKGGALKPEVRRLFEAGGVYVLFLARDCVEQSKHDRIDAVKAGVREASVAEGGALVDPANVFIFDASEIAAWVNVFPAAMTRVFSFLGKAGAGAQTWEELAGYADFSGPFVEKDDDRAKIIEGLRQAASSPRTVTRLLGSSGMGKTRLILEAFRPSSDPSSDPTQQRLASSFCYMEPGRVPDAASVLLEWRRSQCSGTVVVDDCPIELHDRLAKEILRGDSELSLITIGHDLDESSYMGGSTNILKLASASEPLISGILEASFSELDQGDRRFIVSDLADGYPLMAIRVAEAKRANAPLSGRLPLHVLERLLGRSIAEGSVAAKVISACALFGQIGFDGDVASEREFVREVFCPDVSSSDFYAEIIAFEKCGSIGRYGRLVQVRPPPVAIRLAAEWWEKCSPERAEQIVGLHFPQPLADAFCARLRLLKSVAALAAITEKLCGHSGPFGQAKVLSSSLGSQLFRAISEVNPQAAAAAITAAFDGYSTADLMLVEGTPRRNLVWALEKIAFWETTFAAASDFLARLACAENETWSNNATGVLARLFMVLLAGTQAPLDTRLACLRRMTRSEDSTMRVVSLTVLDRALTTDRFVGSSGPEYQSDSGPLPQYRPKVWKEVFDFWGECLEEITLLVERADENSSRAASTIASHIRGLVRMGRLDDVELAIKRVVGVQGVVWPEALDAIKDTLKYDLSEDNEVSRLGAQRLEQWVQLLTPIELSERLRLFVTRPPYESEESTDGSWIDVAARNAESLGRECGEQWTTLGLDLASVMRGEQRQAYSFGVGLAKGSSVSPQLFDLLVGALASVPFEDVNSSVVSGWLAVVDEQDGRTCDHLIQALASHDQIARSLPYIVRGPKLNDYRIQLIEKLVESRVVRPMQLYGLSYGQGMSEVSVPEVARLNRVLLKEGVEGAWVALDVLYMYSYGESGRFSALESEFAAILCTKGMMKAKEIQRHAHAYEVVAERLIPTSPELSAFLMGELVRTVQGDGEPGRYFVEKLAATLFDRQPEAAWAVFKQAVSDSDRKERWRLTFAIGSRGIGREGRSPISKVPFALVKAWCDEAPRVAPQILAELVDPLDEDRDRFSDAAQMLIDDFGDVPEVLQEIAAKVHTFSWSGSPVPIFDRQLAALNPLLGHPRGTVRAWAAKMIASAHRSKVQANLEEAERHAGRL